MTFEAKSTAAILFTLLTAGAWYIVTLVRVWGDTPLDEIVYQPLVVGMVVLIIILAAASHIALAVIFRREADDHDERDRQISLRSERVSAYVLAVGTFLGIGLAMVQSEHFWIAHALLGALFAAEIVEGVMKLVLYRRGL